MLAGLKPHNIPIKRLTINPEKVGDCSLCLSCLLAFVWIPCCTSTPGGNQTSLLQHHSKVPFSSGANGCQVLSGWKAASSAVLLILPELDVGHIIAQAMVHTVFFVKPA